jgi:hypothetical protein
MFSSLIFLLVYFLPESPRWLYVNDKKEQARDMLTKYHGEGNPENEWVKLQMNEYEELLEMDGADKRWWDYRALFKNKSTCYRLFCNVCITIFGQWAGNGKPNSVIHKAKFHQPCQLYYPISSAKSWTPLASMAHSAKQMSL